MLEIERKFLIESPSSWLEFSKLLDCIIDIKRIYQTYLVAEKNQPAVRIRKTISGLSGDTNIIYHYNKKKPVESGVHEETEHEISKKEYEASLKKSSPDKCAVEKTRFVFKWHDQIFELDLFKGHLKGLAILEIELDNINDSVELPPFLKLIKEVTKDKKFTNFSLADKKYHESKD